MFFRYWLVVLSLGSLAFSLVQPVVAQAPDLAAQLQTLVQRAQAGTKAAERNDLPGMQQAYAQIEEVWAVEEDQVRAQNPSAYVEIETTLDNVKERVQATPLAPKDVRQAYEALIHEVNEMSAPVAQGEATGALASGGTLTEQVRKLDLLSTALDRGAVQEAQAQFAHVLQAWPSVEGTIAAKSPAAYTAIEHDLGRVAAALKAQPADLVSARTAVERLRITFAPFTVQQTYSMFDAAAIILREGLEALLVVGALLAFVRRSGNQQKAIWIWAGALFGILVSIGAAFLLQMIFSRVSIGQNREVIEGVTGLVAAGLLFYVSYWLHSKASLHGWQRYLDTQTQQALARGNLLGLALLAFLAVFREGAETTIFYLGIASAIQWNDLLLGIGLGSGALLVLALLMYVAGLRLPLRWFFRIAGLLVYYLGFKFLGTGLHELQMAGVLPVSPLGFLKEIPFLGIYPTWETLMPQLLLLAVALAFLVYLKGLDQQIPMKTPPAGV